MAIASSKKGFEKSKPIKTTNNAWKTIPWTKVQRKV
ncbi:MAG: reverse transcriptase, partial [Limnospira sp. PMC 289.06]|nr:reverse transcriptase [Limnospira sp. PMC 289.06]